MYLSIVIMDGSFESYYGWKLLVLYVHVSGFHYAAPGPARRVRVLGVHRTAPGPVRPFS